MSDVKFNAEGKEGTLTYGECLGPTAEIETVENATQYLKDYVEYQKQFVDSYEEAERICRTNIGYFAGYFDHDTAQKVLKLFKVVHPIFGTVIPIEDS